MHRRDDLTHPADLTVALASLHELTQHQAELLARLVLDTLGTPRAITEADLDDAIEALADGAVAEAFVLHHLDPTIPGRATGALGLAREIVARRPDAPAGAHLLHAHTEEAFGDPALLEVALRRAERLDPQLRLALRGLGDVAAMRGRWREARRWHERAQCPGFGWIAMLSTLARRGPISARRHAPCPCESGRRYGDCCHRTDGWPLTVRAVALHGKLLAWTSRPEGVRQLLGLAEVAVERHLVTNWRRAAIEGGTDAAADAARVLAEAVFDEHLIDLHLLDGGGLGRVRAQLAPYLPDDEATLLAIWEGARHRVWEVVEGGGQHGRATLRLLGSDESCMVELGDGTWPRRSLVLAAVVPSRLHHDGDNVEACHDDLILFGEPLRLARAQAAPVVAAITAGDAAELVRLVVAPRLAAAAAATAAARDFGLDAAPRGRWLLGRDVEPEALGDPGLVDDLVTAAYMPGGGHSAAGDHLRAAARRILAAEPPEAWEAALRLDAAGMEKSEIIVVQAVAWCAARAEALDDPTVDESDELRRRLVLLPELPPTTAQARSQRQAGEGSTGDGPATEL